MAAVQWPQHAHVVRPRKYSKTSLPLYVMDTAYSVRYLNPCVYICIIYDDDD